MRKSEQVCARVTPAEMTTLRALAEKHSILLSEFIKTDARRKGEQAHDRRGSQRGIARASPNGICSVSVSLSVSYGPPL